MSPGSARPPTCSASALAAGSSRSTMPTTAPAADSRRTRAAPIPDAPPVTSAALPLRSTSATPQESIQHPGSERQRVDRHPLVDPVEQRGEVEVGWQQKRGETEAAYAQVG